jgi:hypothetical protein
MIYSLVILFLQRIQSFCDALQGRLQGLDLILKPGAILIWDISKTVTETTATSTATKSQAATPKAASAALPVAVTVATTCAGTLSYGSGSISIWHVVTSFQVSTCLSKIGVYQCSSVVNPVMNFS